MDKELEPQNFIDRAKETVTGWTKEGRAWLKGMRKLNNTAPTLVLRQITDLSENPGLVNIDKVYGPELPDTDDPEVRELRVINQAKVEDELKETFEMNLSQRLEFIRHRLFNGLPIVRGNPPTQYRENQLQRQLGVFKENYASAELISGYISSLQKKIEELTPKIYYSSDADSKARRLAAVIYCLGIPIHPYSDGNGQTLRLTMLSYLQELSPQIYGDKFFPYKPTNHGDNLEDNLTTPILRQFTQTRLMGEMVGNGMLSILDERRKFALTNKWYMKDPFDASDHHEVTEEEMKELFPEPDSEPLFRTRFNDYLEYSNRLDERLSGNHWSQTHVNKMLHYVLMTQIGHEFIKRYVLDPEKLRQEKQDETLPIALLRVMNVFDGIEGEIDSLLEDKDTHLRKFEKAKQQAISTKKRARR